MKIPKETKTYIIIAIVILLAYFLIKHDITDVLKYFGIGKSDAEKKAENLEDKGKKTINAENAFAPLYYQKAMQTQMVKIWSNGSRGLLFQKWICSSIHNSLTTNIPIVPYLYTINFDMNLPFGIGDTNEQTVAMFRRFQYKTQVSQIADLFQKTYQKDLQNFLKNNLNGSTGELAYNEILEIVNNLPSGISARPQPKPNKK